MKLIKLTDYFEDFTSLSEIRVVDSFFFSYS